VPVVAAGVERAAHHGGGQTLEEERGRGMGRLRGAARTSGPTCRCGARTGTVGRRRETFLSHEEIVHSLVFLVVGEMFFSKIFI